MIHGFRGKLRACGAASLAVCALVACNMVPYEPQKATRPYPFDLPQGSVAQVQVIPDSNSLRLINATATDYRDFDLWLNQRYVVRMHELLAGQTVEVALNTMWDQDGGTPFSGGLFRYFQPTPIVLVQIQTDDKSPLIGLVSTLPESVRER